MTLPGYLANVRMNLQGDVFNTVWERHTEFPSPVAAKLAAIYMDEGLREQFDEQLTARAGRVLLEGREIIIGGGLHAAIYAAVRARNNKVTSYVLEKGEVGGAFAVTRKPSFYLNSRNRPGPLSLPGRLGALNVLPGAPVQPSDLSSQDYQSNDVLRFVIRTTLVAFSRVFPGYTVKSVENIRKGNRDRVRVVTDQGTFVGKRVIVATGLGEPTTLVAKLGNNMPMKSDRVMNFDQFMKRMDGPFPFRGMKRVAVIGGGDGGKTVVENLIGQGPAQMSVASLDWPETIDWYGAPFTTRQEWEQNCRSRYKPIGKALYDTNKGPGQKVQVRVRTLCNLVTPGFDMAMVGSEPYDYVIECVGYQQKPLVDDLVAYKVGEEVVAKRNGNIFVVGPAANIVLSEREREISPAVAFPENLASMFRYAPKTAMLAQALN